VARDAQKTDGKMMMQGLMLSDEAEILSKPELEIYADDVVCGHGSTCGKLDEDSLFYLVSRGIPKAEAETMLVRGFLAELLDPIEDAALNEALQAVVDNWLLNAK
jgi:Fe-S cluster assembly protein SufD